MDKNQAETVSDALMAAHRSTLDASIENARAREQRAMARQHAAGWSLAGVAAGAFVGFFLGGGFVGGFIGLGLGAAFGRWRAARRSGDSERRGE